MGGNECVDKHGNAQKKTNNHRPFDQSMMKVECATTDASNSENNNAGEELILQSDPSLSFFSDS